MARNIFFFLIKQKHTVNTFVTCNMPLRDDLLCFASFICLQKKYIFVSRKLVGKKQYCEGRSRTRDLGTLKPLTFITRPGGHFKKKKTKAANPRIEKDHFPKFGSDRLGG